MNLYMFDLELRFSNEKKSRWDKNFVIEKIRTHEAVYKIKAKTPNTEL